jgi:glycolate oxidase
VECDGKPDAATAEINQVVELCETKGAISVTRAANNQERAQLWLARKKGVGAMGRLAPTIVTHDGVIPPSRLPEMLDEVYRIAEEAGVGVANLFHAGDGNLHPIFYFDERDPGKVDAVVAAGEKIIRLCLELGGSVTGEHGVGVEKADLLRMMYDEPSLQFQSQVREIFGSTDLCNPCKVIPDAKGCVEHKVRWRGVAT